MTDENHQPSRRASNLATTSTSTPDLRRALMPTQPRAPFNHYSTRDTPSGSESLDSQKSRRNPSLSKMSPSSSVNMSHSRSSLNSPDHNVNFSRPLSSGSVLSSGRAAGACHAPNTAPKSRFSFTSRGSRPRSLLSTPDNNGIHVRPEAAASTTGLSLSLPKKSRFSTLRRKVSSRSLGFSSSPTPDIWEEASVTSEAGTPSLTASVSSKKSGRSLMDRLRRRPKDDKRSASFEHRPQTSHDLISKWAGETTAPTSTGRSASVSSFRSGRFSFALPDNPTTPAQHRPRTSRDLLDKWNSRRPLSISEAGRSSPLGSILSPPSSDDEFEFIEPDMHVDSPKDILQRAKVRASVDGFSSPLGSPALLISDYEDTIQEKPTIPAPGPKSPLRVIRSREILELSLPSKIAADTPTKVSPAETDAKDVGPVEQAIVAHNLSLMSPKKIFSREPTPVKNELSLMPLVEVLSQTPQPAEHLSIMPPQTIFSQQPEAAVHKLSLMPPMEVLSQEPKLAEHNLSLSSPKVMFTLEPLPVNHHLTLASPMVIIDQAPITPIVPLLSVSINTGIFIEPVSPQKVKARGLSPVGFLTIAFACMAVPVLSFLVENIATEVADCLIRKLQFALVVVFVLAVALGLFGHYLFDFLLGAAWKWEE